MSSASSDSAVGDRAEARPLVFAPRTVVVVSVLAAGLLAALGSLSDVCLGDECAHVRHTRAYAATGERVPYDATFDFFGWNTVPFNGTPLWHAGLAVLWRVAGGESQTLAQIYQAGFFLLLVLSIYFAVRSIWGDSAASWAWLAVGTMPMVAAYTLLLYQDMPGTAIAALVIVLLWRRRFLWCGVGLAGAYLAKMNMLTFAPWAGVVALWSAGGGWRRRLSAAALVIVPVAIVFAWDLHWRFDVYGNMTGSQVLLDTILESKAATLSPATRDALYARPADFVNWKPYDFRDPKSILSHFGLLALVGVLLAVARARDRAAVWFWLGLLLAVGGFISVFVPMGSTQVRYLFPAVPVLVPLAGRALAGWRLRRWLRVAVVSACAVQVLSATGYVFVSRQISAHGREAYQWVRRNSDPAAWIMFPAQALTNQTGRPFAWDPLNVAYFMSEATNEQRSELLEFFGVSHIVIPLRRVYDSAEEGSHAGGYSKQFVTEAASLPYLSKVFENPAFIIFEVLSAPAPGRGRAVSRPAPQRLPAGKSPCPPRATASPP